MLFTRNFPQAFCLYTLLLAVLIPCKATAHFNVGTQVRQFVISETDKATEIYIRTPIPLLFGDVLSSNPTGEEGFLVNRGTPEAPLLFLSTARIKAARAAFTQRLARTFIWNVRGNDVSGRVRSYRIIPVRPEIPMVSVAAGKKSLSRPSAQGEISIGSGQVDLLITLPTIVENAQLTLRSGLPPVPLAEGIFIDNHFTELRGPERLSYTRPGQLERPIALPRSRLGVMLEYVHQGFLHILEGIDHVFLVIAMALGAAGVMALVRAVSAFTLGHAITLAAGFLGYAPQGSWFIPTVEAAIAATIVVAVVSSYRRIPASSVIYALIGLLHGFGFSFVLGSLLGRNSPDLIPALAAFTAGIEIGQLAIVAAVLLALTLAYRLSPKVEKTLRLGTLATLGGMAIVMTLQRIPAIFST